MAPNRDFGDRLVDVAKNQADYQWRRQVRSILPAWAHPLLPGEQGSVEMNILREADRRFIGPAVAGVFGCVGALLTGAAGLVAMGWALLFR